MTDKVTATLHIEQDKLPLVMSYLEDIGLKPSMSDMQRHNGNEKPDSGGVNLVLIHFKNMGEYKSWRLVEFFGGTWIFEGREFENMDEGDFEIVCWYELPEEA